MKAPARNAAARRAAARARDVTAASPASSNGSAPAEPTAEDEQPRAVDPAPMNPEAPTSSTMATVVEALRRDWRLAASLVFMALGVTFVLLGWYGAAQTNIATEQMPYLISGGLLGLGLIVVAGFFAATAASDREVRALRGEIVAALARAGVDRRAAGETAPTDARVYALRGGRSYHVAGCPIIEGKPGVRELGPATASSDGLAACKLCASD